MPNDTQRSHSVLVRVEVGAPSVEHESAAIKAVSDLVDYLNKVDRNATYKVITHHVDQAGGTAGCPEA